MPKKIPRIDVYKVRLNGNNSQGSIYFPLKNDRQLYFNVCFSSTFAAAWFLCSHEYFSATFTFAQTWYILLDM
jgi:hypothetical protein